MLGERDKIQLKPYPIKLIIQNYKRMIQNLWILCSICLIISIMIHNPKSQGMGGQNQLLNGTRSAEETLNRTTWAFISVFFILTIYLATLGKLD